MNLSLKASVAEFLAMAVLDLFPGTVLGDFHLSATQFRYQFYFNQPKHPELLPLLEEKMRGILKSEPQIEEVEMAVASAVHYFEHLEQPFKAEMAENAESVTVPMIRIGNFYDIQKARPYCGDFSSVAFQLLEAKELEEGIEISGTAFFSKEELKAFIKHRKAWLKAKPWEAPERFELLAEGALLPKGVELFRIIEQFWRKAIHSQNLQEVLTRNQEVYPRLAEQLRGGIAEWAIQNEPIDLCYFSTSEQQLRQRCISSLQFIHQTFIMLSLRADWVLCEKADARKENQLLKSVLEACQFHYTVETAPFSKLELRIHDSLGEQWPGPFLRVSLGSPKASVEYSLLGPIKRFIALLAEAAFSSGRTPEKMISNEGEVETA